MMIGIGLGLTMARVGALPFIFGLSNANATGGTALSCAGSLLAYAQNTLRWGCLDGKRAVLVEAAATNLLSGQVHNSDTMTGGASYALTPFPSVLIFTAPAGTGGRYVYPTSTISVTVDSTYTVSAWVASSERYVTVFGGTVAFGKSKYAVIDLIDGAVIHAVGCTASATKMLGMCRVTMTAAATSTTTSWPYGVAISDGSNSRFPSIVTDGTETLTVFGGQVEAGSAATSYIPTSGSAATRAADLVTAPITADVSNGVRVRGTFRMDAVKGGYDRVFQFDDGDNDNSMTLHWVAALGAFRVEQWANSVSQGGVNVAGPELGDTCQFDISFTPAGVVGVLAGVSFSFAGAGGYVVPTVARLGSNTIGGAIPARLLCSKFLVSGV